MIRTCPSESTGVRRWPMTCLLLLLTAGCNVSSLRRDLPPEESLDFRAAAMDALKKAAFSDVPNTRIQALEAFQEIGTREGVECLGINITNRFGDVTVKNYTGVTFAGLMALGTLRNAEFIEQIRNRAEDPDPHVKIAALFALHRLGDQRRTGEVGDYLLHHSDARVRANAAIAIGRLGEPKSVKLLRRALQQEDKIAPKIQILEALAIYGDEHGIERLIAFAYDPRPDLVALALMCLADAECPAAEKLFRLRLASSDYPETKLAAALGLGKLGSDDGLDLAIAYLYFKTPDKSRPDDPPEQQISRARGLAALALEAIGSPLAIGPLRDAFEADGQSEYVRLAAARAAIRIIDRRRGRLP